MNQIAKISNFKQFIDYDIAHVIDLPSNWSYSTNKIIKNLSSNIGLKQVLFSTRDFGYENLIKIIEKLNIKIIHVHSNTPNIISALKRNKTNAKVIQTVHANVESLLGNRADVLVCIHSEGYLKNNKFNNVVVIENTVEKPNVIKKTFNNKRQIVTNCRIDDYYINSKNISVYKKIFATYNIYGYNKEFDIHNDSFKSLIKDIQNTKINILEWSYDINRVLLENDIYGFYQSKSYDKLCYGLSVMEAANVGIPIVALKRKQENQKYIIDGYNGFIVDSDTDFIDKVNKMVVDDILFEEIFKNSIEHTKTLKNEMPIYYEQIYKENIL